MRSSILAVPIAVALSLGACAQSTSPENSAAGDTVAFEEATLIVETNATDGDAGLQVFLDHEPWKSIAISRPDGTKILDVTTRNVLRDYGLTELFSESSEPPFSEFPFEEFKKLFPAGRYTFAGETIEGVKLQSSVTLTHDIPDGPKILSPEEDSTVAVDELVVRWEPGTQPEGIEIVAYEVIVEREDPLRVFSADLPATARELSVSPEFMQAGTEYKVEVLAIEKGGNQTLTEVPFSTE